MQDLTLSLDRGAESIPWSKLNVVDPSVLSLQKYNIFS